MTVEELDRIPGLLPLYGRAVVAGVRGGEGLPDDQVRVREVTFDPDHLAAYDRVCGFTLRDTVPSTYPHVVAFPLTVHLMARREFPFPLPGLVHLGQRIVQRRPISVGETVSVHARTADLRPHAKGQQFDVIADVEVGGEPVWRAVSTYLRRGGGAAAGHTSGGAGSGADGAGGGADGAVSSRDDGATTDSWIALEGAPAATWRIGADAGRRYAVVSGDRNPIHLNRLTSRLGGFPRPIAHGMWTMARCLAALEGRVPDRHTVEVAFGRPVSLPSRVELRTVPTAEGWLLDLRDANRGKLHLTGRLTEEDVT
jgi:acyl dehydratase